MAPLRPIRETADPNNTIQYHCMFPDCNGLLTDSETACDQHLRVHFPPRRRGASEGGYRRKDVVKCLWKEGTTECISTATVADMGRHLLTHFSITQWRCPVAGCDNRPYDREDSTLRHMKEKH